MECRAVASSALRGLPWRDTSSGGSSSARVCCPRCWALTSQVKAPAHSGWAELHGRRLLAGSSRGGGEERALWGLLYEGTDPITGAPPLPLDHLPEVPPPHTIPFRDGDLTYGLWGTQTSVWSGLLCFSIMGGARRAWCRNGKYTDFPGASGAALPSAKGTHVWREEASQGTSCGQCGAYRGPPRAVFLQCGVCGGCGDAPWCLLWSWDVEGGFPPRSRPHWALLCSGHGDRPLGGHSEALYGPGSGCWTIPCRD